MSPETKWFKEVGVTLYKSRYNSWKKSVVIEKCTLKKWWVNLASKESSLLSRKCVFDTCVISFCLELNIANPLSKVTKLESWVFFELQRRMANFILNTHAITNFRKAILWCKNIFYSLWFIGAYRNWCIKRKFKWKLGVAD